MDLLDEAAALLTEIEEQLMKPRETPWPMELHHSRVHKMVRRLRNEARCTCVLRGQTVVKACGTHTAWREAIAREEERRPTSFDDLLERCFTLIRELDVDRRDDAVEALIRQFLVRNRGRVLWALTGQPLEPIPMLLWCPSCRARHIDEGEFETKEHHTHACQACGMVWRPALGPTVGVRFLPGFKNAPAPALRPPRHVTNAEGDCVPWCSGCRWRIDNGLLTNWEPPAAPVTPAEARGQVVSHDREQCSLAHGGPFCRGCKWRVDNGLPLGWEPPGRAEVTDAGR